MELTTFIISGFKRAGTTLLNRLFDSEPGIIDYNDEAYFWEHVYRYDEAGRIDLFVDLFRSFSADELIQGFIDRDILPWIEGRYVRQAVVNEYELDLGLDQERFRAGLAGLAGCETVQDIWTVLTRAYADAMDTDYSGCTRTMIKSADFGLGILSSRKYLDRVRHLFLVRNPFYTLDSLKKSRMRRQQKILHPFNFAEAVRDLTFFWQNRERILGPDTYCIQYERLVSKPREVMEEVAAHLGIPFTENLLRPTMLGKDWEGYSSFSLASGIDASMLDRPLKMLEPHEVRFVGRHLAEMLEHYGYVPGQQRPAKG